MSKKAKETKSKDKTMEDTMAQKKTPQGTASKSIKQAVEEKTKDIIGLTELDQYLFGQGTHYDIYKKLGAHVANKDGVPGAIFAVWAPNAKSVSVVGDFNGWNITTHVMKVLKNIGIYELFIPEAGLGSMYKFYIQTKDGRGLYKSDPYANYAQKRPDNASIIVDIMDYKWHDKNWMAKREIADSKTMPMSVYEVHPASWKKHPYSEDNEDGFYNYRELAYSLVEYIHDMGYTHVELMGIAEYPYDASWGYQVTGYYAPTSRYGTPQDFMYLVDYLHKNKIGVILDWVPAHFPKDAHGLAEFDGTCTYEYSDPKQGEQTDWGTKVFDFGKNEVKNFLICSALFWIEQFHVDGLRVDAVASMLYLDYGKEHGQWVPNKYGENKNLDTIEFFRHLNTVVLGRNKGTVMIAEESTAWPLVTGGVKDGGLNFSFKWNMGWMHDFLEYMKLDPYFRKDNHNKMTFTMSYAYSENYLLVLSHDEVVHLKCSMINKMPGEYEEKFANLMVGYSFMIGHPGKKLLFMGQDFGQFQEWSEERELDWYLLGEEKHQQLNLFVKKLLHLYVKYPALYEQDCQPDGFEWINADDRYRSIFSFLRHKKDGKKSLLFVCNFTPVARTDYKVGVPKKKQYRLVLDSDNVVFGGSAGEEKPATYKAVEQECDGRPYSIAYSLPAYGVAVFEY